MFRDIYEKLPTGPFFRRYETVILLFSALSNTIVTISANVAEGKKYEENGVPDALYDQVYGSLLEAWKILIITARGLHIDLSSLYRDMVPDNDYKIGLGRLIIFNDSLEKFLTKSDSYHLRVHQDLMEEFQIYMEWLLQVGAECKIPIHEIIRDIKEDIDSNQIIEDFKRLFSYEN